MRKMFFAIVVIMLVNASFVFAHEHNFTETKQLIDLGVSCDKLTDEQLEAIGEYYMEQMHPGEAHELMDEMMGGEGSESLKQMHIQMAKRLYCKENVGGMMGSGSMNMMGSGMMGNWGHGSGYWNFINILYVLLLIGLIILVYFWIITLWKNSHAKKK